ncbi:hypothetical protein, partial [Pseudomonas putida]|uniref:hypothetical protein n=1 Tax=Pseudomonas putida TaxID=303 RepID=UPI003905AFA6
GARVRCAAKRPPDSRVVLKLGGAALRPIDAVRRHDKRGSHRKARWPDKWQFAFIWFEIALNQVVQRVFVFLGSIPIRTNPVRFAKA